MYIHIYNYVFKILFILKGRSSARTMLYTATVRRIMRRFIRCWSSSDRGPAGQSCVCIRSTRVDAVHRHRGCCMCVSSAMSCYGDGFSITGGRSLAARASRGMCVVALFSSHRHSYTCYYVKEIQQRPAA